MLTKLRTLASLFRQAGFRWSIFRAAYAFRLRTGWIRLQLPAFKWTDRPLQTWLRKDVPSTPESYLEWRRKNAPAFFFKEASLPEQVPWDRQSAIDEAGRILSGEIKYFAHEFQKPGFPPAWSTDPVSGLGLPEAHYWSTLTHDGALDIKFIWEAGRFGMLYPLVRAYAATKDEIYARAFWKLILDWAEHNQPNTGPNWMDGQEIALRLMAWSFGFYAFLDSPSTKPEYVSQFTSMVAAQAQRIYRNLGYAISTQSNHTISEACGLWLTGTLFPELKGSDTYLSVGRDLLEGEAVRQLFPDGSYSMYSINYHRFVLQTYFYAMRLAELNHSKFSDQVYRVATSSIAYLSQLIDPQTGQMPVYGSNDGALVLPLNACDFTDYRPLLQLGSFMTKGRKIFEPGPWDEDLFWLCGPQSLHADVVKTVQTGRGFSDGGTYVMHGPQSKVVIRCTKFRSRPSHADQLHVDLWWRGHNIACDAGTYLYSGSGPWRNGLARTSVHNTVSVDFKDQMNMVSRFTWINWAQGNVLQQGGNLWQGQHDGYSRLSDPVAHKRTVLNLGKDRWLVIDHLHAEHAHHYALQWLINDFPFIQNGTGICLWPETEKYKVQLGLMEGESAFSLVRAASDSTRGWRSRYYGQKEPAVSAMLETDRSNACFWTYFGFESDLLTVQAASLRISGQDFSSLIDLDLPVRNTPP